MNPWVWTLAFGLVSGPQPATPRFAERVVVRAYRDPNQALQAFLEGRELTRGAAGGVPSRGEMESVRPQVSPSADVLSLLAYLATKAAKAGRAPGAPRFYVYELRAGETAMASLREAPIPLEASLAFPGVAVRLVGEYRDRTQAVRAFREAERAARARER